MRLRCCGAMLCMFLVACSGAPATSDTPRAAGDEPTVATGMLAQRNALRIPARALPLESKRLEHFGLKPDTYVSPAGDLEVWWSSCTGLASEPAVVWLPTSATGLTREHDSPSGNPMLRTWGHHAVLVVPTLRGQHGNPGNHEYLWGEVDDVLAAVAWARSQPCVDPDRVHVVGQLEGGTLAMLAAVSGQLDVAGVYVTRAYLDLTNSVRNGWTPLERPTPDEIRFRSPINFLQFASSPIHIIEDFRIAWINEVAEEWAPNKVRSAVLPECDEPLLQTLFADALLEVLQDRPWPSDRALHEWHAARTGFYATEIPSDGQNSLVSGCLAGSDVLCASLERQARAWRDGPSARAFVTLRRACVDNAHAATCEEYADYVRETQQDEGLALKPARDLCAKGDAKGCVVVAYLVTFGRFVGEEGEAERLLQRGCELGHLESCHTLAELAYWSHLGERQVERARDLREEACAAGHGEACTSLGVQYHEGAGVPQSMEKSYELYARACELGSALGCSNASARLESGTGVTKDERRSFELARKSCKLGSATGCTQLALRYREGVGTVEDLGAAERIYKHACHYGNGTACLNLATDLANGRYGNAADARFYYGRAAQKYEISCYQDNHGRACVDLAELIEDGNYSSNDDPVALRKRGCELDTRACDD